MSGSERGMPGAGGLDTRIVVRRSGFELDLALAVAPGEVVALLGPNGAGKTTALRALAGLVPLSGGHLRVGGEDLAARAPERRRIGMVFQDYLLFPHLSALDNVAFGLRYGPSGAPSGPRAGRGAGWGTGRGRRAAARREAAHWLERVGLADRAGARPRELSGGQAQRVALARALAVRPGLLLLDEPLAALDAHTRLEIRAALRRHLDGFDGAAVLVTHDPLDAMALADRLVVLEGGRVAQEGAPADVARHPRTRYVARLVGLNLYRGSVRSDGRVEVAGGAVLDVADGTAGADGAGEVFLAFDPSAVALYRSEPDGSPRNRWHAIVAGMERHGDRVRVQLDAPRISVAADVTAASVAELSLAEGGGVWAAVKATETRVYPA